MNILPIIHRSMFLSLGIGLLASVSGCSSTAPDMIAQERAKLDPADRTLVEVQEWCAIMTEKRLGSMGPPIKLTLNGEPVFLCCKGCRRKAEADPEKTLAKVAELKAKAKVGSP